MSNYGRPGYHRTFWGHAAQDVYRPVEIPARSLGVAPYEYLAPISTGVKLQGPAQLVGPAVAPTKDVGSGYQGIPGRGSLTPPEESLRFGGYYGPGISGV